MAKLRRSLMWGMAAAAAALASAPAAALTQLTIFHNNDGESKLLPTKIGGVDYAGAALFVSAINELRSAAIGAGRDVLTISSGDNFLAGTAFNASLTNGTFYDAQVINAIGYDALVLGNHDFDFGTSTLASFIQEANSAPFISSNLDFSNVAPLSNLANAGRIAGSVVVDRGGNRYGIVGATTQDLNIISSPGDTIINPVVASVQAQVDALEAAGVNKIIFASHLQSLSVDQSVVSQLSGIDIVIAGGSDALLTNTQPVGTPDPFNQLVQGEYPLLYTDADGQQIPVVSTAGEYRYVGAINATFDDNGLLLSIDTGSNPVIVNANAFTPDSDILANVIAPVQASITALGANIIGTTDVALDGRTASVRTRSTNLGDLIGDAFVYQAEQLEAQQGGVLTGSATISLTNGGGIRNNSIIPIGNISELTTFDILPFSNFLAVINDVSAQDLRALLEYSIAALPNANGRFGQIGGFSYTYDPTRPVGGRVQSITLADGTVIYAFGAFLTNAVFDLVTNSFTAANGDGYPFSQLGLDFTNYGVSYQQSLFNYINDAGGLGGAISSAQYGTSTRISIAAVPEPATWAMMIGGFGLVGASLRRRKVSVRFA